MNQKLPDLKIHFDNFNLTLDSEIFYRRIKYEKIGCKLDIYPYGDFY